MPFSYQRFRTTFAMRETRALTVVATFVAFLCAGCPDTRRASGEECLRNEDCVSDYCLLRQCTPEPPRNQLTPPPATQPDAGVVDAHAEPDDAGFADEG